MLYYSNGKTKVRESNRECEHSICTSHRNPAAVRQVRFKDEFYGHSEKGAISSTPTPVDAVAEWRDLQNATPPIRLADHLTWLRVQGEASDPRLLATIADRLPARLTSVRGNTATMPDRNGGESFAVPPAVPLGPILHMTKGGREGESTDGAWRRVGGKNGETGEESQRGRSRLTHGVHTSMKENRSGDGRLPGPGRWTGGEGEEKGRGASKGEEASAATRRCGFLHLVVDGVVFQVEAARPTGISRVWENVLPAVSKRPAPAPVLSPLLADIGPNLIPSS